MANKLNKVANAHSFSVVRSQMHNPIDHEKMQSEINNIKYKLEQASKDLAQKDLLIDSLEMDLEHMIDQLVKMQHSRKQCSEQQQWIARGVPGLHTEVSNHA